MGKQRLIVGWEIGAECCVTKNDELVFFKDVSIKYIKELATHKKY